MTPNILVKKICDAYKTAGVEAIPNYGSEINPDTVAEYVKTFNACNIIMLEPLAPTRQIMDATAGRIMEGNAVIFSCSKRDQLACEEFYRFWSVLNSDGAGNFTRDVYRKTNLGELFFIHWAATQKLPATPVEYGNVWVMEVQVEFAIGVNRDN